jgi:putative ABC transport system substrate-binding protein
MLKEVAPQTVRVAILGNPKTAVYFDYLLGAAQAVAPTLGMEAIPSHIENDAADIERTIAAIASMPNASMVVLPDSTTFINQDLIITLAARNSLPAVYCFKFIVQAGGLMCPTGPDAAGSLEQQQGKWHPPHPQNSSATANAIHTLANL